jgi:tRNA G10  N-methylase Trm11
MIYLFSLGRTSALCFQELESLLKIYQIPYKITYLEDSHVIIESENEIDTKKLIDQSGGIIKISSFIDVIPEKRLPASGEGIQDLVEKIGTGIGSEKRYKNFGLSLIGFQANIQDLSEQIKSKIKLHYSLPKSGHELSSAQVYDKKFLEIIVVKTEVEYQIFQTVAVQDIIHWTKKDVGRPNIDDQLGMLPLKVARMMINITFSSLSFPRKWESITLLDPFCGMGSVLEEALDLGVDNIIGSDINADVLDRCQKNAEWFKNNFDRKTAKTEYILSDAVKISDHIKQKIDLIVTEPFLGDAKKIKRINEMTNIRFDESGSEKLAHSVPRESNSLIRGNPRVGITNQTPKNTTLEIKKIVKGLEKMYLGALKDWQKILKKDGVICMIIPEFEVKNQIFKIPFIEICAKVGYNIVSENEYSRENAVVRRKIYLLKIRNSNSETRNNK